MKACNKPLYDFGACLVCVREKCPNETKETDIPKMSTSSFELGGGMILIAHKSYYLDCLHIKMDRYHAWDFVQNVLNQLRDEERDEIRFSACGKLSTNEGE